jgi:hypothetical protein
VLPCRGLLAPALALAAVAAGCGSGTGGSATAPAPPTPAPTANPPRTALPLGWKRVVNPGAGFSVGLPPGWSARAAAGTTVLRSADRGLAVSVASDRSAAGREGPPRDYALRALEGLTGYRDLRIQTAAPLPGARYPAAAAAAAGTYAATGVRQRILVQALWLRGRAMYTLIAFSSARAPRGRYRSVLAQLVATFHAEPARQAPV